MTSASTTLPPTPVQAAYARKIAMRLNEVIPWEIASDRRALSNWISKRQGAFSKIVKSAWEQTPSGKQIQFAERIAKIKRRDVPRECYQNADLMSRWIIHNKTGL